MTGLSGSFIPARPAAKESAVPLAPTQDSSPRLWQPTPDSASRWYPLELPAFGHRRPRVLFDPPTDCNRRASDGLEMIVRTHESAQESSGSCRLCSLPRSHPGHRQEYIRTHGPWIAASGSS